MDDRRSHWPIYDVVSIEMIKIVSETIRRANVDTVKNKNGMVIYFLGKGGESSKKVEERS